MSVINLSQKLSLFSEHWRPKVVAEANGAEIKLAKIEGEFLFHHHDGADEVFLCLAGSMEIDLGEDDATRQTHVLHAGEMMVVPAGMRHRTRAAQEAHILILAPKGLRNTGAETHPTLTAPDGVRV